MKDTSLITPYRLVGMLFLFVTLVPGALAEEIDPNWSPDLSDLSAYPGTPTNWPLCGHTTNPSSSWYQGAPCTSTLPDRIVSSYGPRLSQSAYDFHRGIDLRSWEMEEDDKPGCGLDCIPNTRPVFAVAQGEIDKVTFKCENQEPDGFRIQIRHGSPTGGPPTGEWYTRYVHLSSLKPLSGIEAPDCKLSNNNNFDYSDMFDGMLVGGGQHIGYTGKSASNNHHLHFEVRKDDDWSRDAVHPLRKLPPVASPGSIEVSIHAPDLPRIEVTSGRLDVVRTELQVAGCNEPGSGSTPICDPFIPIMPSPSGYVVAPTYYDYELFNYQYSHRGGTLWTSTGGFPACPFFNGIHDSAGDDYQADYHLTDASFNSIAVTLTDGIKPYYRSFRFDGAQIPVFGSHDYTCIRAVATMADGSIFYSTKFECRPTAQASVVSR